MTTYLLAGGGTAGHVNPLLAVADALRERDPDAQVLVLGTREGLEARLVPLRGYELLIVDKVPFPRRPNRAAASFPARFRGAIAQVRTLLTERAVDVVVGFGGYASAPAYVAAARAKVPYVVHEANARPGLANVLGARRASAVGVAFAGTRLRGSTVVGMPLRHEIVDLDRHALHTEAAAHFGLDPDRPTLLVFGGSLGARQLNAAFGGAWQDVLDARYVGTTEAQTTINGSLGAKWAGGRYTTTLKVVNLTNKQVLQHVFADVSRRQIIGELRVTLPK